MIAFLDTHVAVWLYQKSLHLLSPEAIRAIEDSELRISPMGVLEMEYLREIGRIRRGGRAIVDYLAAKIGLQVETADFASILHVALDENWTRDPFDRIIVSHARLENAPLISGDERIRAAYARTVF